MENPQLTVLNDDGLKAHGGKEQDTAPATLLGVGLEMLTGQGEK